MNKNFKLGQSNEIIKSDKVYDLHNLYRFKELFLKAQDWQLTLLFEPILEYREKQPPVSLIFTKIDYLEFSPGFGCKPISGLDEVGYKSPEDRDDIWLMSEEQATNNDHLYFRMDGGEFIRLHCQNADLVEIGWLKYVQPPQN